MTFARLQREVWMPCSPLCRRVSPPWICLGPVGFCSLVVSSLLGGGGGRRGAGGGEGQQGSRVSSSCTRPQSGTVGFALGGREKEKNDKERNAKPFPWGRKGCSQSSVSFIPSGWEGQIDCQSTCQSNKHSDRKEWEGTQTGLPGKAS